MDGSLKRPNRHRSWDPRSQRAPWPKLSILGVSLQKSNHMITKDTQNDHKDTLKYNHETQKDQVETQQDYKDSKAP